MLKARTVFHLASISIPSFNGTHLLRRMDFPVPPNSTSWLSRWYHGPKYRVSYPSESADGSKEIDSQWKDPAPDVTNATAANTAGVQYRRLSHQIEWRFPSMTRQATQYRSKVRLNSLYIGLVVVNAISHTIRGLIYYWKRMETRKWNKMEKPTC